MSCTVICNRSEIEKYWGYMQETLKGINTFQAALDSSITTLENLRNEYRNRLVAYNNNPTTALYNEALNSYNQILSQQKVVEARRSDLYNFVQLYGGYASEMFKQCTCNK